MTKKILAKQVVINGLFHKIGINGYPYMKVNGDWVRSTKSAEEVQALLDERNGNVNGKGK